MYERDEDLVQRAKSGDSKAYDEIYELYVRKIYLYVYYRVTEVELAEDLTAEVFVRLVKKIDTFEY